MSDGKERPNSLTHKPILVGGFGEINFGTQYKPGNRVYDSQAIAMCVLANSIGYRGGHSYLYLVRGYSNEGEKENFNHKT